MSDVFSELSPPYSTVVADPPWPFRWSGGPGKRRNASPLRYSLLTVDAICGPNFGVGHMPRHCHEPLLVCRRGGLPWSRSAPAPTPRLGPLGPRLKVRFWCESPWAGCECDEEFDLADDATEQDILEEYTQWIHENFPGGFERIVEAQS